MKKLLLILSVLLAAPAWAGEAAATAEQAAAPAAQIAVTVALSGASKGVRALLAELEKDAVYKEAGCSAKPMKKPAKTARISCTNASGALLDYLGKNTPSKIRWSISGAAPLTMSTAASTCAKQTCSGILSCYFPRCGGACNTCP